MEFEIVDELDTSQEETPQDIVKAEIKSEDVEMKTEKPNNQMGSEMKQEFLKKFDDKFDEFKGKVDEEEKKILEVIETIKNERLAFHKMRFEKLKTKFETLIDSSKVCNNDVQKIERFLNRTDYSLGIFSASKVKDAVKDPVKDAVKNSKEKLDKKKQENESRWFFFRNYAQMTAFSCFETP